MPTPHEFYLQVIGKAFDEDGVYGVQCVDGFKAFCRLVLGWNIGKTAICNPTKYATSIWDNFERLGFNKYFDKVPANQMVDGDWAIWQKGSRPCPYSHVAMFRKDNGNGTGVFLGQNQNGARAFNQVNISYSGLRGAFRPKIYHQETGHKNYVNLPPQYDSWAFYRLDSAPVKKNAIGNLNPKKFGGLSYYIYSYRDNRTTAEIQTIQFGRVKIYIHNTPATITYDRYLYKNGNH